MIKFIATDLDGTLADKEGRIPREAFAVIKELARRNITFAVATGRQAVSVENDFEAVKDSIYVIAENGAVIKKNGCYQHVTTLDQQKAKEVIARLEALPDAYFMVCCKDKAYQNRQVAHFDKELDKYYHARVYREDLTTIDDEIVKIAVYHPEDVTREIEGIIRTDYEDTFKILVSGKHWLDIGSPASDKGKAVAMLQEDLKITQEECMAFGDYYNDVEMLKQVKYSYAMAHALPDIKAVAREEAPTGGVLEIIKAVYSS